jgi:hypothetical protein
MPKTTYYANRRGGHCPGHVRDTFLAALDAYSEWHPGEHEPLVEFEVNHQQRQIPISKACGLVWNCSDILPGDSVDELDDDIKEEIRHRTYGAVARAIYARLKDDPPVASE